MTIAQIKALFKTGKIPTQADFENLISKIPNSESTAWGDSTLNFSDPTHASVLGYRQVTISNTASYLFIGFYDSTEGTYVPYIIVHCDAGTPTGFSNTPPVKYTILTSGMMKKMLSQGGKLYSSSDGALVGAIPADAKWNWVGCHCISDTHRVIENDLVEEHFIIATDNFTKAYFKLFYSNESDTFPIVSEATKVRVLGTNVLIDNYILTSIKSVNNYKKDLDYILNSPAIEAQKLIDFTTKYMTPIKASI